MMESSRSLRVAVIDENASNLNAFTRILEKIGGVEPLTFSSAPAALTQLAETDVSLLIMDHHLPPVDGDEVITKFRALTGKADVPVLVVSDDPAPESRHRMVERGATMVLQKPVDRIELTAIVKHLLHMRTETRRLRHELEGAVDRTCVAALLGTAKLRDRGLFSHLESVAELSATLAAMLGMKPESISQVRLASRLHDIGKLVWQDRILTSREMLASHDRVEVQAHADAGANLLAAFANSPTLRLAAEMARSHHERLDGTGYPRGLKADQISTEVRIVSVASAFVAMRSPRPYREPLGISVALTHIQGLKDAAYDAEVVQALQNTMTAPVSGETRT